MLVAVARRCGCGRDTAISCSGCQEAFCAACWDTHRAQLSRQLSELHAHIAGALRTHHGRRIPFQFPVIQW